MTLQDPLEPVTTGSLRVAQFIALQKPFVVKIRQCRIIFPVHTVSETPIFQKYADEVWSESERTEFINWIAANPQAGDVVPGSSGCRKVRWARQGMGKRGGARVIYFNEVEGRIWLLIVYAKAKFDNLPAEFLAQLKREVENGQVN